MQNRERGDVATVERHLKALRLERMAEAYQVYRQLGKHSLELAQKNGLNEERAEQIRELLDPPHRKRNDK